MFWSKKTIWNVGMVFVAVRHDIFTKVTGCIMVAVGLIVVGSDSASADYTFSTPINLGSPVNSPSEEAGPSMSADKLSLFFDSDRPGGQGEWDIWTATRASVSDPWREPTNLGQRVNSDSFDFAPSISANGLELYFGSNRSGAWDLWVATRATTSSTWAEPTNLGSTVNSSGLDAGPSISADGLELFFFSSLRSGGYGGDDLWVTTRSTPSDTWGTPVNLGTTVNSSANDGSPSISADGLLLFFESDRPGGYGDWDIWVTRRASLSDPWEEPVNLGPTVNTSSSETLQCTSPDGRELYFSDFGSSRPGGIGKSDLWQVSIEPIVDLNHDGTVDSADLCIMIDHWGTDEPLCDIGPMPWGDGIVDIQDMVVFAEHLLGEALPVDLVAHWKLDESDGIHTKDSAGDNDAIVVGSPTSLPTGGMVDGALEFDGIMDCLITDSVLNPEDGPFRVFAWIKGGAPGQIVLSQSAGADWLATDAIEGKLITGLAGSGPDGSPLASQTIITDGEWHLIGFAWDGSHRTLYVDNVAVAKDTQDGLRASSMGLYIGAGKMMQPGTYFSGLIDDVRIYNRAIRP